MGQVTVTLTGDEARLLRALDRVVAKEKEVGRAGKEAAKDHTEAFAGVEERLQKLVTAGALWGAGLSAIKSGYDEIKRSVESVADAVKKMNEVGASNVRGEGAAFRQLSQLGDVSAFAAARRLKDEGGLGEAEAAQAVLGMRRSGLTDESSMRLAIMAARGGLGPDALTRAAAVTRGLGQSVNATNVGEILGQSASVSPGNTSEFMEALARDAPVAARLGISGQELIAAQSQLARTTGSPERAARGLHELLENFDKRGVKGFNLSDMVRRSRGVAGSEKSLMERFGNRGLETLRALDPDALSAEAKGLPLGVDQLFGALDSLRQDPAMSAFLAERDASAVEARQLQSRGIGSIRRQQRRTQIQNSMRARGVSEAAIQRFMQRQDDLMDSPFVGGIDDTFGDSSKREALDEIGEGGIGGAIGTGSAQKQLDRIAKASERNAQNTARRESLVNERKDK